jgi:hypothetical protein
MNKILQGCKKMEVEEEAYYEYLKPLTPKLKITNTKKKSFKCDNNMHKFIFFNLEHSKMKLGAIEIFSLLFP